MSERLVLREARNVPEALERDALVRRIQAIRADVLLQKHTIEHWNRAHPSEPPLETTWEDAMIAWCDGKGPCPPAPEHSRE